MKEVKPGKYSTFPIEHCDRCSVLTEIHITTDGGFFLCDSCVKKMTFDREHRVD